MAVPTVEISAAAIWRRGRVETVLLAAAAAISSTSGSAADEHLPPDNQMKSYIMQKVGDLLLDGESARYRWPDRVDQFVYCGFVNGKNSYGAYVGFRPFFIIGTDNNGPRGDGKFSSIDEPTIAGTERDSETRIVYRMCEESGYDLSHIPPAGEE